MKVAAIAMSCVLLAGVAVSEPVKAGERETIVGNFLVFVHANDKPIEGASVEFRQGEILRYSFLTNENGIATPHQLPFGDYHVVVTHDEDASESVLLHVVENGESTTIQINLVSPDVPEVPSDLPAGQLVQSLRGIVTDWSGAVVPGAKVRVARKVAGHPTILHLKADAMGRFSGELGEGSYVAFVFASGFQTALVPFEIAKEGSGVLGVKLAIRNSLPIT